jgi:hypothetical protein
MKREIKIILDKTINFKKENKPSQQNAKTNIKNWPSYIIKLAGTWKDFPSLKEIRKHG